MRQLIFVLSLILSIANFVGCGNSNESSGGNDNTAPVVLITAPSDGSSHTIRDMISFTGSCEDDEDGSVSGASLVWTSDIDGQIGTGDTCSIDTLTYGIHLITLTATDSNGATGSDSIEVTVFGVLPDTGQTDSYTDIFGEDSDYIINHPTYTKLDASGNSLEAGAEQWAMVKDEVTGLIWEAKTETGGIHYYGNSYTWQDAQDVFINQLNNSNFGGYSDWRLPTIKELFSLVNVDSFRPATNQFYFPNTNLIIWSSTTEAEMNDHAWYLHFVFGIPAHYNKSQHDWVRAVRGDQTFSYLVDNGDGTVTAIDTGLMWQQAETGAMEWETALTYCETLELAGYDDWRLPNIIELQSLIDYAVRNPAIDTTYFTSAVPSVYWSSTPSYHIENYIIVHGVLHLVWGVNFNRGDTDKYIVDGLPPNQYNVRAVRSAK